MALPSLTGPLTDLHDGELTSVIVSEGAATFGLTHVDGRKFTLVLKGVEALSINDFREGNIISELQVVSGPRLEDVGLTRAEIRQILEVLFTAPHPDAERKYHDQYEVGMEAAMERLEQSEVCLVVLDPAYGADLVAYCASAEIEESVQTDPADLSAGD